jgi:hypothetical protein
MSVALFSKSEIAKLYNTLSLDKNVQKFVTELDFFEKRNKFGSESAKNFIGRAVWYGYIANVNAYNVQYRENEQIDLIWKARRSLRSFKMLFNY